MTRFVLRRAGHAVVSIIAATFLLYVGLFVLGDPFATNQERRVAPETHAALWAKFGMDEPLPVRYLVFLRNLCTGDLGIDFERRQPVVDLVLDALPNTARLALFAMAVQLVIGIFAGVVAALRHRSFLDVLISTSTILLLAVPGFVTAILLRSQLTGLQVFGVEVFAPVPVPFGADVPWYTRIGLPLMVMATIELAVITRLTRASMLDVLTAEFIRTARAKGISERRVVLRHALRNALIPVVNLAGVTFGVLLGGSFIIEGIFEYPGLGYLLFRSLAEQNGPVIVAVTVYSTVLFIVLSALVDVLSAYLDPRVRVN